MICPDCRGEKRVGIKIGGPPGDEAFAWYKCSRCAGTGVVTAELDRCWVAGRAFRERRIARHESLRTAAARLNLTLAQLCDIENGRIDLAQLPAIAGLR